MTSEQIRYARGLAETHAPKSTDPIRETTEARPTIELLPRLTLKLLDEREALLAAARHVVDAASSGRGPMTAGELRLQAAIAKAESP